MFSRLRTEQRGSAVAEFTLVGALLTLLTLAIVQLGLALHIRNMVQDAASEGARAAALAGASLDDGAERTRHLIEVALGSTFAEDIAVRYTDFATVRSTEVTVRTPLPLIGLFGISEGLEVSGHAAVETHE